MRPDKAEFSSSIEAMLASIAFTSTSIALILSAIDAICAMVSSVTVCGFGRAFTSSKTRPAQMDAAKT